MSHVSGWCSPGPVGSRPQCERCKVPACAHSCHESQSIEGTKGGTIETSPQGALTPAGSNRPTRITEQRG